MNASTKAFYLAAAGSAIAVSGIYWFFTWERDWGLSTYLLIWLCATMIAWPGVLQDMANGKIVDGDRQLPPPPPKKEERARPATEDEFLPHIPTSERFMRDY